MTQISGHNPILGQNKNYQKTPSPTKVKAFYCHFCKHANYYLQKTVKLEFFWQVVCFANLRKASKLKKCHHIEFMENVTNYTHKFVSTHNLGQIMWQKEKKIKQNGEV